MKSVYGVRTMISNEITSEISIFNFIIREACLAIAIFISLLSFLFLLYIKELTNKSWCLNGIAFCVTMQKWHDLYTFKCHFQPSDNDEDGSGLEWLRNVCLVGIFFFFSISFIITWFRKRFFVLVCRIYDFVIGLKKKQFFFVYFLVFVANAH